MITVLTALSLAVVLILAWAWVIFPLVIRLAPHRPVEPVRDIDACRIHILLSAHNEEDGIKGCLDSLFEAADELPERWEMDIRVGDDCSTDATWSILEEYAQSRDRLRVTRYERNIGKTAVLKSLFAGLPEASFESEFLVFTDANTRFHKQALRRLLEPMKDPNVGGVCGKLELGPGNVETASRFPLPASPSPPEGFYWRWENRLKEWESEVDSCLGANGAIYSIRRELFWLDLPENTVVDDFVLGMKVREQGPRMIYDKSALAFEPLPETAHEWQRRVRIGSGDYQALSLCGRCLLPRYGWFAAAFLSHKVLRWFTPHFLVGLGLLSVATESVVRFTSGQASGPARGFIRSANFLVITFLFLFVVLGLLGRSLQTSSLRIATVPKLCEHFLRMQTALFVGFLRFLRGDLRGAWSRTPR